VRPLAAIMPAKTGVPTVVTADLAIRLFVIPMLYVTFQSIRERSSARFRRLRPRPTGTD
jgi:hypothetical protein